VEREFSKDGDEEGNRILNPTLTMRISTEV
jgi:hypothetical protein